MDRTIKVRWQLHEPKSLVLKRWNDKFEVINAGNLVHEFNIANAMMHKKHQPEMEEIVENEILLVTQLIEKNEKNG